MASIRWFADGMRDALACACAFSIGSVLGLAFWVAVLCFVHGCEVEAKEVREILVRGRPFPRNVAVLVDASGSMRGATYEAAVSEAVSIARQATDDTRMRFYAFTDSVSDDPQGWIGLPDAVAVENVRSFLEGRAPMNDGAATDIPNVVAVAIADDVDPLGVVLITDGDPDSKEPIAAETVRRISAMNAARSPNPALIGVIVVHPRTNLQGRVAASIARRGGGACLKVVSE